MRFLDVAGSGNGELPRKSDDLDTFGRDWTAHNVIRNQQVSGSSPLAGSSLSPLFIDSYWHSPRATFAASSRVGCI